ncbi:MAG: terminase family protein, partial [Pseudomonadota bacterium]
FGESGLIRCSPPDRVPEWQATRRRLVWPNGAVAQTFSASDPESLRGPQFDCAWLDEFAKWKKAQETFDMLQFALRLGDDPRQVVTTTPRAIGALSDLLADKRTVRTSAPTRENAANLAASFLDTVSERYGGSAIGRQELEGELLTDIPGALWSRQGLEEARLPEVPELDRIIVAVDPPVTGTKQSDACGIIVVGARLQGEPRDWRAFVLEDASLEAASPGEWAAAALERMRHWRADRLVAEVNQGGDLVETVMRQMDPMVPYRAVRASRGKVARAEPVAALYEQGRVAHVGLHPELEDQMCWMARSGYTGTGSPDRVDALVWALTDLMITPAEQFRAPRLRSL